jgi:hypothetical protein
MSATTSMMSQLPPFSYKSNGDLTVHIGGRYPSTRVRDAFAELEARKTTGKLLIITTNET